MLHPIPTADAPVPTSDIYMPVMLPCMGDANLPPTYEDNTGPFESTTTDPAHSDCNNSSGKNIVPDAVPVDLHDSNSSAPSSPPLTEMEDVLSSGDVSEYSLSVVDESEAADEFDAAMDTELSDCGSDLLLMRKARNDKRARSSEHRSKMKQAWLSGSFKVDEVKRRAYKEAARKLDPKPSSSTGRSGRSVTRAVEPGVQWR